MEILGTLTDLHRPALAQRGIHSESTGHHNVALVLTLLTFYVFV